MSEKSIVFDQWIQQHPGLNNLMHGKVPSSIFEDAFRWKEHTLFSDFSMYLASFQGAIYGSFSSLEDENQLAMVVSYFQLFTSDAQQFLEQKLTQKWFDKLQNKLIVAKSSASETALLEITDSICNDDSITLINNISRKSYPLKIQYLDAVLSFIHHPSCTARLAYRLIKQLKKLDINAEHRKTIDTVESELKSGKLLYNRKQGKVNFRSVVRPLLVLVMIACCGLGIYYLIGRENQVEDDIEIASSFEDFTKEERIQIDSLIRTMQTNTTVTQQEDIFQWLGNGVVLSLRTPLNNIRMEQLYNDWLLDAALIENSKIDTCISAKTMQFPGVLESSKLAGSHKVIFKNESMYQVLCFVFEQTKQGKVYQQFIDKGATATIKINQNQGLLFVPGNDLGVFSCPTTAQKEECPSASFTRHFCETDASLGLSLSSIYYLSKPSTTNKIMFVGDSTTQFSVLDLYGILETN
ncbi:MAG: hypothetical protein V4638_09625 [Bacteroidota bacterium]